MSYPYVCALRSPVRDEVLLLGDDLGVVRRERRCDIGAGAMDLLDQRGDPRRHHEEVVRVGSAGVPIGVRRPAPSEDGRSGRRRDLVISHAETERSGEHVPRLVVPVMNVQRRNPVFTNLGRPLNDHEVVARGAKAALRKILDVHGFDDLTSALVLAGSRAVDASAPAILEIGLVLLAAACAGLLMRRVGLPAVVGYMVVGLLVSPFTPGYAVDRHQLQLFADIGVVLLLFEVGIEMCFPSGTCSQCSSSSPSGA